MSMALSTVIKKQLYHCVLGDITTLNDLYLAIKKALDSLGITVTPSEPEYRDFRAGDVRYSQAVVSKAQELLGYAPSHRIGEGIDEAMPWYKGFLG